MNRKNYHFYVFTGGIKTGKSTSVLNWTKKHNNIGGIVQTQDGDRRFIIDLSSKEKRELTSREKNNSLIVGKYFFDKSVIQWGKEILLKAVNEKTEWLIFDEYGISEFQNECFEPEVSKIFYMIKDNNLKMKALIVVRESLLESFISRFENDFEFEIIKSLSEL